MIERIPLLLHGLRYFRTPMESPGTGRDFIGYLMIELNLEALQQELFPELAQRVFGGTQGGIYQIAVIDKTRSDGILYQSGDGLPPDFFSSPDARTGLPLGPRDQPERTARDGFAAETRPQPDTDALQQPPLRSPQYPFPSGPGRPRNSMIVMPDPAGNSWQLLVRHHGGTLAQVVEKQRRRNLAVSFGILLVLATSMAMIVVSTQRAQRLAKLQMEFVAGVSHELRTPLSVICSAGDNLAEGVVPAANEQVRQYGELVRQEGRRLAGMVERILLFAKTQDGRQKYELRPAQVDELLESTLAKLQPAIDSAGFTLERQVESGLPPVSVHNAVFSQCLENLVNNSLKYGGEKRWLRVCAGSISTRRGCEVRITVEDRGIGIEPSDLPYIFEPFYRGKAGISAQIHGSGLGLSLAQQGIEAMGGRISVRSTPGEGSSFTIHLPAVLSTEASHSPQAEVS
jgi:signal transduction histidine kinase